MPASALVTGASGATGRLLTRALLRRGLCVRAVVRSRDRLPAELQNHERLSVIEAAILDLDDAGMARIVDGCGAVASCLGHNLSLRGMYGRPRMLVSEAVRRLCLAIEASRPHQPVRLVLMNTAGNSNRDIPECVSRKERAVVTLIRSLLPPHRDNERAADYLRTQIGQDHGAVAWAAVRPDTLVDADEVTAYDVHPSPTRSAIFDAGQTSRINVADFMAGLMTDDDSWGNWKGQMPVIYNRGPEAGARRSRADA